MKQRKLSICGRIYTISVGHLPDALGICESGHARITISDNLEEHTDQPAELIVLHEVIHAIMFETGLTHMVNEKTEEAITHALALQLHTIGYRLTPKNR